MPDPLFSRLVLEGTNTLAPFETARLHSSAAETSQLRLSCSEVAESPEDFVVGRMVLHRLIHVISVFRQPCMKP